MHPHAPLTSDDLVEQEALIALSLVPGAGPGRIRALIAHFGSAQAVRTASKHALSRVPGVGSQVAEAIVRFDDESRVQAQRQRAAQVEAEFITVWDDRFPDLLGHIYDPPVYLWMRGTLHPDDGRAVAIVGTRKATPYGLQVAHNLAADLARKGMTIVSGLAYGIDTAAHQGALEAGGRTLAVLGSGVDRIYPARNDRLAQRIIRQGALLSEFPLGAAPDAQNFPRRNRIVSGLSLGVVVVEAHASGGALITARLALEQNREVFAVPGEFDRPASEGTHGLIQNGYAKLITGVDDVLVELEGLTSAAESVSGERDHVVPEPTLNESERRLWDHLTGEPVHIDVLCAQTDLDVSTALVHLLGLEFRGLVRQMAGKQFYRTY